MNATARRVSRPHAERLFAFLFLIAVIGNASATTFSPAGTPVSRQDSVTLVPDLPFSGGLTTQIYGSGGGVNLRPFAGVFEGTDSVNKTLDTNVAEDGANLVTAKMGPFALTSFGLLCAVCLSFRRPAPTNGPAPAPGSVEAAIRRMRSAYPAAVLMEIRFHGTSGADGLRTLKSACRDAELLVLAEDGDSRSFEAMCAGAPDSPETPRRVVALLPRVVPSQTPEYRLTRQETRVLNLLGSGHCYKTAAADLGVKLNTLCFHVRHIYDKLQVHSKSEAVAKAFRDGVLQ